jgi:hypothetical protein
MRDFKEEEEEEEKEKERLSGVVLHFTIRYICVRSGRGLKIRRRKKGKMGNEKVGSPILNQSLTYVSRCNLSPINHFR